MTHVIEAIYENGVLRPLERLALKEHERVQVTVQSAGVATGDGEGERWPSDPLEGIRVSTGISDLAEHFEARTHGLLA